MMHASRRPTLEQQKRIQRRCETTDSYAFFNLLTGPQLLDGVEELLPAHRERLFPPTETLAMFLAQLLAADGSCRQAVNDAVLKRVSAVCRAAARGRARTARRGHGYRRK